MASVRGMSQLARPETGGKARFFATAQAHAPPESVWYVWGEASTISPSATPRSSGMARRDGHEETSRGDWQPQRGWFSASTGNFPKHAPVLPTPKSTYVPDVESPTTEHRSALVQKESDSRVYDVGRRKKEALTPYHPQAWAEELSKHGLNGKYPHLPKGLIEGFDVGIPIINSTYSPYNSPSLNVLPDAYAEITEREFTIGRYLGPFSKCEIENLIGPFQSSPLSLVAKPGKPGKYRAVHNFSYPHTPSLSTQSINSSINAEDYPCTYGTFATICLIISRLPPDSQVSVRDVAEAYRTIPVKPSQWPGLVVRLRDVDQFAINTNNNFGLTSAGGVYGIFADAGADIFRANGMGPVSKWVDDHIFFRVRPKYLQEYNKRRAAWHREIAENGGCIHEGSRIWYSGKIMPDGRPEEFDEDCSLILQNLQGVLPSPIADEDDYSYGDSDIDLLSSHLGIRWENSKTIPWGVRAPYLGFIWDLENGTVSIPERKKQKYLAAIEEWETHSAHALLEVQKLHGKLLHTTLVVPEGRAYLTNLETMLAFSNCPFVPHTPPRDTKYDLEWWKQLLRSPTIMRTIPKPTAITDRHAYSDASSGVGIAIVVGDRWRAWKLIPGWKSEGRDIGWAEAVGFEFLTRFLFSESEAGTHIKAFGDNLGVVEGWWKGRSRNKQTNAVFRRIHELSRHHNCIVHSRYVPSAENPADKPSRGIYPPICFLLPLIPIPKEIAPYVVDVNHA